MKVDFASKDLTDGTSLEDDVFSEYPCLLLGNKMIYKNNIGEFLKKTTNINDKFRNDEQAL